VIVEKVARWQYETGLIMFPQLPDKGSHAARLGLEFVFLCFKVALFISAFVYVLFYPETVELFPFMFLRLCSKLE